MIDATNQMGQAVANSRAALPAGIRYAQARNTAGGENMADPNSSDGPADMCFSDPRMTEPPSRTSSRASACDPSTWALTKRN